MNDGTTPEKELKDKSLAIDQLCRAVIVPSVI